MRRCLVPVVPALLARLAKRGGVERQRSSQALRKRNQLCRWSAGSCRHRTLCVRVHARVQSCGLSVGCTGERTQRAWCAIMSRLCWRRLSAAPRDAEQDTRCISLVTTYGPARRCARALSAQPGRGKRALQPTSTPGWLLGGHAAAMRRRVVPHRFGHTCGLLWSAAARASAPSDHPSRTSRLPCAGVQLGFEASRPSKHESLLLSCIASSVCLVTSSERLAAAFPRCQRAMGAGGVRHGPRARRPGCWEAVPQCAVTTGAPSLLAR
jgi:hypothetical protein